MQVSKVGPHEDGNAEKGGPISVRQLFLKHASLAQLECLLKVEEQSDAKLNKRLLSYISQYPKSCSKRSGSAEEQISATQSDTPNGEASPEALELEEAIGRLVEDCKDKLEIKFRDTVASLQRSLSDTESKLIKAEQSALKSQQHAEKCEAQIASLEGSVDLIQREKNEQLAELSGDVLNLKTLLAAESERAAQRQQRLLDERSRTLSLEESKARANAKFQETLQTFATELTSLKSQLQLLRSFTLGDALESCKARVVQSVGETLVPFVQSLNSKLAQTSALNASLQQQLNAATGQKSTLQAQLLKAETRCETAISDAAALQVEIETLKKNYRIQTAKLSQKPAVKNKWSNTRSIKCRSVGTDPDYQLFVRASAEADAVLQRDKAAILSAHESLVSELLARHSVNLAAKEELISQYEQQVALLKRERAVVTTQTEQLEKFQRQVESLTAEKARADAKNELLENRLKELHAKEVRLISRNEERQRALSAEAEDLRMALERTLRELHLQEQANAQRSIAAVTVQQQPQTLIHESQLVNRLTAECESLSRELEQLRDEHVSAIERLHNQCDHDREFAVKKLKEYYEPICKRLELQNRQLKEKLWAAILDLTTLSEERQQLVNLSNDLCAQVAVAKEQQRSGFGGVVNLLVSNGSAEGLTSNALKVSKVKGSQRKTVSIKPKVRNWNQVED